MKTFGKILTGAFVAGMLAFSLNGSTSYGVENVNALGGPASASASAALGKVKAYCDPITTNECELSEGGVTVKGSGQPTIEITE